MKNRSTIFFFFIPNIRSKSTFFIPEIGTQYHLLDRIIIIPHVTRLQMRTEECIPEMRLSTLTRACVYLHTDKTVRDVRVVSRDFLSDRRFQLARAVLSVCSPYTINMRALYLYSRGLALLRIFIHIIIIRVLRFFSKRTHIICTHYVHAYYNVGIHVYICPTRLNRHDGRAFIKCDL